MNRKRLSFGIGIAIISVSVIGGTLAWFTDKQEVSNKISTGAIKHTIIEKFDENTSQNLLPGEEINKDVWIHNIEKSDSLLRVKITPIWVNENGDKVADATSEEVTAVIKNDKWTLGNDGYYYYNEVFKSHNKDEAHPSSEEIDEETTLPTCYSDQLLNSIALSGNLSDQDKYANRKLDVIVKSETVQVNKDAYNTEWEVSDNKITTLLNGLVNSQKNN
ncbi:MAG: BsaA family SipW-dependent biofilm matrix protein [Clostridium sp.]|uniref:BsaA family SipW-dependent biofilm matrix protein n=1 Tax=Clostridium sp. TaxID=1506 RepID=UPI003F3F1A90